MKANDTIGLISGLIGCIASIVSLIPFIQGPLQRCFSYIEKRQERLIAFEKQVDKFKEVEKLAKSQAFEGNHLWFNKVDNFFEEYNAFKPRIDIENPRILFGLLPDYYGMYRNSRRIENLSRQLKWLEHGYERKVKESAGKSEELIKERKDLSAHRQVANQIRSSLGENKTKILLVWGAGGTGKTKVVSHVFDTLSGQYWTFDNRFWVAASQDDDLQKLHVKIAGEIGLRLPSDGDVSENADMIMKTLLLKGKFLLVLDNIWNAFTCEEIGIPPGGGQYTVIITSRYRSVCREMASKVIELKFLSNGEAEKLLRAELNNVSISKQVEPILKSAVEECGGLPLAVVTAASLLRKLDLNIEPAAYWESKLKSLVMEEVFQNLKPSYKHLKFSEHSCIQKCFTYCTLQPRKYDFGAKELMEHWMWGGLLGDVKRIEEHLAEAQEILNELKDACLLESTPQERDLEKVKMHPLIWETAVRITKSSGAKFFTKFGGGIGEHFYKDWPEDVERVSLKGTDLTELRPGLRFDKLTTLILHDITKIQLHPDFFKSVPNLTLLDLSNTNVNSLPDSISVLKHLNALFLRKCEDLTILPATLPELIALKALDISGSPVEKLPYEMHCLNKLIRLDLSQTKVTSFQPGLVDKLYKLQELMMIGCNLKWESKSPMPAESSDSAAYVQDLTELKDLSVLEITFGSTQIFRHYATSKRWVRLTSFKFSVGDVYTGKMGTNSLAFIKEFPNDPDDWLPSTTLELLVMHVDEETLLTRRPSFENLRVVDVSFCAKLKYVFKRESMSILKHLEEIVVQDCINLEKVIEKDDPQGSTATNTRVTMSKLQKVTLLNLPLLRSVSDDEITCDSIRSIGIWNCENLVKFPLLINHSKKGPLAEKIEVKGDETGLKNLQAQFAADAKALLQCNLTRATSMKDLISWDRIEAVEEAGPKQIKYVA